MEIWKDIEGYEGLYKVSSYGNVYSCKSGINLSWKETKRYPKVVLNKNGVREEKTIHRLVAEAFIPNPDNKLQVDHIDTDKLNNHVENLRWCTSKENARNPKTLKNKSISFTGRKWCDEARDNAGKLRRAYYFHWFNNGTQEILAQQCPEGYYCGRLK